MRLIRWLVMLGLAASFFIGQPGFAASNAATLQSVFIVLFGAATIIALSQRRVVASALTTSEWILYATAILSAAVSLLTAAPTSMLYTMAFLAALVLNSLLIRTFTLCELLDLGAELMMALVFLSVIFGFHDLLRALSVTMTRTGLFRFEPFGNHADLTGFMFGAGSILMARRVRLAPDVWDRFLMAMGTALAWVSIFAASSRASVLALIIASGLALVLEIRYTRAVATSLLSGTAVAGVLLSMTPIGGRALDWIAGMLEFHSRYRGIGSGGSGRTDLWRHGLLTFLGEPSLMIFGGGLRSSDIPNIGFSTEDSYITILLDSGLFIGMSLIAIYVYCLIRALLTRSGKSNEAVYFAFVPSFFLFLMVESIFNRYLLGIGNPMSLYVLLIIMALPLHFARQPHAQASPAESAAG